MVETMFGGVMGELFDTTHLRQRTALRRHLAGAHLAGQGDLFGVGAAGATAPRTVRAYVAVGDGVLGTVFVVGGACRRCDAAVDPYNRAGVPCRNAAGTRGMWS